MLQGGGRVGSERLLSRASVALMTTDHLSAEEKAGARILLGDHGGWGYGLSVTTRRTDLCGSPGRFGWNGGSGCSAYADPAEDLVGILLTQRCMESPRPPEVFADFWTSVYQALD
jgi:CubicO group peptidase (beta-lactamase class C family)